MIWHKKFKSSNENGHNWNFTLSCSIEYTTYSCVPNNCPWALILLGNFIKWEVIFYVIPKKSYLIFCALIRAGLLLGTQVYFQTLHSILGILYELYFMLSIVYIKVVLLQKCNVALSSILNSIKSTTNHAMNFPPCNLYVYA